MLIYGNLWKYLLYCDNFTSHTFQTLWDLNVPQAEEGGQQDLETVTHHHCQAEAALPDLRRNILQQETLASSGCVHHSHYHSCYVGIYYNYNINSINHSFNNFHDNPVTDGEPGMYSSFWFELKSQFVSKFINSLNQWQICNTLTQIRKKIHWTWVMNILQVELFGSSNPFQGLLSQETSSTEKSTSTSSPEDKESRFLTTSWSKLQHQDDFLKLCLIF